MTTSDALLQARMSRLRKLTPRSTLEDFLNIFTPNEPVTIPAQFAGRDKALDDLTAGLLTHGANLVVFGERGSGKSSLANMVYAIARGNLEVLDYYPGLRERLEKRGLIAQITGGRAGVQQKTFKAIWVNGLGRSLDQVIHAALTRRADGQYGPGLLAYLPTEADQIEVSSKIGFDKVFVGETSVKEVIVPEKAINIKEGFELAVQRFNASHSEEELLLVIDEFETITDRSEMSQYLKSLDVRFVLVAIAETVLELLGQHASVARDTIGIGLLPMSDTELRLVLEIGAVSLQTFCEYGDAAITEIVKHSDGSPYWAKSLAKIALQQKIDNGSDFEAFKRSRGPSVTSFDVQQIVDKLSTRPEFTIYEQAMQQITQQDEITAKILLAIARIRSSIISSEVIHPQTARVGVDRDTTLATVNDILKLKDGPFEERGRIRDVVSFSFRDPNLKRYIVIRNAGLGGPVETPA